MPNYILRISPSMLGRLACDTRAGLASLGYVGPDPSVPAEVGKVMHASFAHRLRGEMHWRALGEWENSELYQKLLAEDQLDDDFRGENLIRIQVEWERRHLVDGQLPFKLEAIEEPFDETLFRVATAIGTVDVRIHGVMDGYGVDEQGFTYILEHKFTRKRIDANFKAGFNMDAQNGAYIWAAARKLKRPVMGSYVNAVSMKKLPDSDKTCRKPGHGSVIYAECGHLHLDEQLFLVDRSSEQLADWQDEVEVAALEYLELLERVKEPGDIPMARMQGQFIRDYCPWCDFKEFCRAHRPVGEIAHWLRKQEDTDDGKRIKSGLTKATE